MEPNALPALVAQKLELLPTRPGVYRFVGAEGRTLYIGKAKSLRQRVRSYFQSEWGDGRAFIPNLHREIVDLDTVITGSEKEAAILENELIKAHRPRYNIKLKDNKDFLCLRLDVREAWPRLETVRRPAPDGARYFGPYESATSARRSLHTVNKHFQLRTCSNAEFQSRRRPCLQYQIKRCLAPCVYDIDEPAYRAQVENVTRLLDGRHEELQRSLKDQMHICARLEEYEMAAVYRDQLKAIDALQEHQRVVAIRDVDQDVIGLYREGPLVELELLCVRAGRLRSAQSHSFKQVETDDAAVLSDFVREYYGELTSPELFPQQLVVQLPLEGQDGIEELLSEAAGHRIRLVVPERGARAEILQMAMDNAAHAFREKQRAGDDVEGRLGALQELLRLPVPPRTIECCDISHTAGTHTVGSVVAMKDGVLDKKKYRLFKVRTVGGGDDYQAMFEVLSRRFRRGREQSDASADSAIPGTPADAQDDGKWALPDLFVVDGGRGQLQVALTAAADLGLHELSVVGLAKERESRTGERVVDRVYLPGQKNGIPLERNSSAMSLLARLRDEAHRFANRGREQGTKQSTLRSELDSIAGLGPTARTALLTHLGSMARVRAASDAEILAVPGVRPQHLRALRKVITGA